MHLAATTREPSHIMVSFSVQNQAAEIDFTMDSGEEMLEEEGKAGKKKPHRVKVQ